MRALCLVAALVLNLSAQTVNYSGKWLIERPQRFGRSQQNILTLNQVGNQVTGTLEGRFSDFSGSPVNRDILDGKVDNGVLTFYVWTGLDKPVKTFYKGTMSGDAITFSITGGLTPTPGSSAPPTPREITAKRTK
jgi:hypothetical protein